ncbi:MAG TPA: hypothetical protein VI756_20255 [Blastocatellia bacterium]
MLTSPLLKPEAGTEGIRWAGGFSLVSYGVRIGIRADNLSALAKLKQLLPPGWKPSDSARGERTYSLVTGGTDSAGRSRLRGKRGRKVLYVGDTELENSGNLRDVFDRFEADLQLHVAEYAKRRVFVHSGSVGWRGKAIIIPGRSFSGKSTLVAALVRAGAVFYSDEYAVLDSRGRVHPFPKPLALRRDGSEEQTRVPVERIGGKAGSRPISVGMIVVSNYKAGANWRPRRLSPGKGALELLSNAVPARSNPVMALNVLRRVVSGAPVFKGQRGSADETARLILQRFDETC